MANGQSFLKQGFIVTLENDTVYGFIDDRSDVSNLSNCVFKKNHESDKERLYPSEIYTYGFNDGKRYVSRTVNLNNSERDVFLELLVKGVVSIYYYRDANNEYFFAEKEIERLIPLISSESRVVQGGKVYIRKSEKYKGVLRYLFKEEPSIVRKVNNVKLTHKSLVDIVSDYQKLVSPEKEEVVLTKKAKDRVFKSGWLLSVSQIDYDVPEEEIDLFEFLSYLHFEKRIQPSAGIFFKVGIPEISQKLFLKNECEINCLWLQAYANYKKAGTYYYADMAINQIKFSDQLMLEYEFFQERRFIPHINGGVFISTNLYTDYKLEMERSYEDLIRYPNYSSNEYPFESLDYGLVAGAGLTTTINEKDLLIDLRYMKGKGLNSLEKPKAMTSHYWILKFGYEF